ncbi:MAG: hypothetical protein WAU36_10380 [Cyclobacteriaceae bacterium]
MSLRRMGLLSGGGASVDANRQFIIDNASFFHDFHLLTGDEGDGITADVIDLTGNGYDLEDASPAATGGAKVGKANFYETEVTCAKLKQTAAAPNVLMFKQGVDSLFLDNGDFEYLWQGFLPEGTSQIDLIGFFDNSDSGVIIQINYTTAQILLFSGSATIANETAWESEAIFPANPTPVGGFTLRFSINKTGAVNPRVFLNGVERTFSLKAGGWGAFSNWDPATFNSGNIKPPVGGYSLSGVLRDRPDRNFLCSRHAFFNRVLTDEEASQVLQAFTTY